MDRLPVKLLLAVLVITTALLMMTTAVSSSAAPPKQQEKEEERSLYEAQQASEAPHHPLSRYPPYNHTLFPDEPFHSSTLINHHHNNHKRAASSVRVEDPFFIPIGQSQDGVVNGSTYRARRFVINNLDANKAAFLLYPYSFNESSTAFPDGALVSTLEKSKYPTLYSSNWFKYVNASAVDLSKAKAIYDSNVAILQVSAERESGTEDLTYESDTFCTMFYSWVSGKYASCFKGLAAWKSWIKSNPLDSQRPVVVFLTPQDIAAGALKSPASGVNQFGMLIVPDIMFNEREYLTALLSSSVAPISSFVTTGGQLFTSGKAAVLLEGLGFIPEGSFDTKLTIKPKGNEVVGIEGCPARSSAPSDASEDEFTRRTLCFSGQRDGTTMLDSLISGPLLASSVASTGMNVVSWFITDPKKTSRVLRQHNEISGFDSLLPLENVTRSYPAIMYKQVGKGQIVAHMANPSYNFWSSNYVYNAFFLAGSRPLVLNAEISGAVNKTIPALERVKLGVKLELQNYFTQAISGTVSVQVWWRTGTTAATTDSSCTLKTTKTLAAPSPLLVNTSYYDCSFSGLAQLGSHSWAFSVEITDPLVSQDATSVMVLWPRVSYTDSRGSASRVIEYGVTVGAAMAALLRGDMNIDPSSMYPFHAKGSWVDNVLNCENKESTTALNVEQISIVPLISPLIDLNDQVKLAWTVAMDTEYYNNKAVNKIGKYNFPYDKTLTPIYDKDFLDWVLLVNRSAMLVASWDEAVKVSRVLRTTLGLTKGTGKDLSGSVPNANYQTTNDDDRFVLKQTAFFDADLYYQHATQRMLAFLDTLDPAAAKSYWPTGIPADQVAKSSLTSAAGPHAKKNVLFARHDVFFWPKYVLPQGLTNSSYLITLDRYAKQPKCGTAYAPVVKGQFGNAVANGIIPQEDPNVMALDCSLLRVTPSEIEAISGSKVKLIHYIVPVDDPDIQQPLDMVGFDANGYLTDYNEVRYVTIYRGLFDVYPNVSRRGGEMIFSFPSNPWGTGASLQAKIDAGFVTFSADQISIYKTWVSSSDSLIHVRFKRGNLPNEAYGQASHLQMILEQPTAWTTATTQVTMSMKELQYDVSKPEQDCEEWSTTPTLKDQAITFTKMGGLSMPALRMSFVLGKDLQSSQMQSYELREPLVRYGIYEQELIAHRPVHGAAEVHPISEPCLVTRNDGFSTITHVGTSSIPFREYLTTGLSQLIPAAPETGRIEWKDVWGRQWSQSVRSTIFEYPPIPPPLRNFEMTTTFEVLDKTGKRQLNWKSDEAADVHVQLKLNNGYPKFFEITSCKANEVLQRCGMKGAQCQKSRVFDTDLQYLATAKDLSSKTQFLFSGHSASYGKCYAQPEVWLSGVHTTQAMREGIQNATYCGTLVGDEDKQCQKVPSGLPVVSRREDTTTTNTWNFAQQIVDHWPQDYIKDNMWDLTHYDYDDNQFDKAYKYHMDNNLPNLYDWITKPENIIAFPLFKGLGYSMVYTPTKTNPRFSGKKTGWWSDNLQNRDHTLVAGQTKSNDIAVGKPSLINDWIDITALTGINDTSAISAALKNVYRCLFNRKIIKIDPANPKMFWYENVLQNNIVPVPPNIQTSWLTQFDCSGTTQYTPETIGLYPNIIYTDTPRDWLYFGANLRGGAKENINILYSLSPLSSTKYEGVAKVQDGGRFVYWNPANSRNSFLVVDNVVNTVMAVRNDISIAQEIIPTYTTTFNALVFHALTLEDAEEDHRTWDLSTYVQHHGYGDFVISVFVGDNGSGAILEKGKTCRVKFTIMNNAGFDINMLKEAITSSKVDQKAINSNDLMFNLVHTLRYPDAYNFLTFNIPADLKPYLTIKPNQEVVGVAPLFFDFEAINVVTIRDGWKGDYYVDMTLSSSFPDSLRGRLHTVSVTLNRQYFDALPGTGDATGVHDYTVSIPNITFGIPYAASHPKWANKVFWTSGYATNLHATANIDAAWSVEDTIVVSEEDLDVLRLCLGRSTDPDQSEQTGEFTCLESAWKSLKKSHSAVPFTLSTTVDSAGSRKLDVTVSKQFPIVAAAANGPDQTKFIVLVRTTAPQLPSGWPTVTRGVFNSFSDWAGTSKTTNVWDWRSIHAKGAWLKLTWSATLLSTSGYPLTNQAVLPTDSGMADISITVLNSGDFYAYNVNFSLTLSAGMFAAIPSDDQFEAPLALPEGCSSVTNATNGHVSLSCFVAKVLAPQSPTTYTFRIAFTPDPRVSSNSDLVGFGRSFSTRAIADNATGFIDLTSTQGERTVQQSLSGYLITYSPYYEPPRAVLNGQKGLIMSTTTLQCSHEISAVTYYVWRARLPGDKNWLNFAITSEPSVEVNVADRREEVLQRSGRATPSGELKLDFMVLLLSSSKPPALNATKMAVVAESNEWKYRPATGNFLWLLLVLPGLAIPLIVGASVFLATPGKHAKPVESLGYGQKTKFVPTEMEFTESPLGGYVSPVVVAPQPVEQQQVQVEAPVQPKQGKEIPRPHGPTYMRAGGVPINIVDSKN